MTAKLTQEEFVSRATEVHNGKYDYSKSVYYRNKEQLIIICPEHGEFLQKPSEHLNKKCGCPRCDKSRKITHEEFISRCIKEHSSKYDYSKTIYVRSSDKVIITCPTHAWRFPATRNRAPEGIWLQAMCP